MDVVWTPTSWEQFVSWYKNDRDIFKRIMLLIEDMVKHPTEGLVKPEPLKHRHQNSNLYPFQGVKP